MMAYSIAAVICGLIMGVLHLLRLSSIRGKQLDKNRKLIDFLQNNSDAPRLEVYGDKKKLQVETNVLPRKNSPEKRISREAMKALLGGNNDKT
jgi:hypothetical protein